ncbi:MAG: molecular chaperone TorD family protein [Alphaproteobacteria bacterium]|nr:molecular chaperone TorD family protein [Alphaproteobacteria bacterium]
MAAHETAEGSDKTEAVFDRFCQSVADDLRLLAFLHGQEPGKETLENLREAPFQDRLGLLLRSEIASEALRLLDASLPSKPAPLEDDRIDALAAAYANVYLIYAYRASPCESVWFDDDGLERQEPMFQVRDWYRRFGLAAVDSERRPDDHLVCQLSFVAELFARRGEEDEVRAAVQFMDEHLLRWIGQFAGRIAGRCQESFFVGLALVTAAYLEELRDLLAQVLDAPRPSREEIDARLKVQSSAAAAAPYVPGAGPGW